MIIVTSFNEKGFQQYGKRMMQSVKLNTPFSLVVYTDGFTLPPSDRVLSIEQRRATPELYKFRSRFRPKPGSYSYRWDASKFAGKSFAIYDAMKTLGKFIWLDGDTVFMRKIKADYFDHCFDYFSCFLGRKGMHTETGFISFNMDCAGGEIFREDFISYYLTDKIYRLREWHDCEVYDQARAASALKFHNLTPEAPRGSHPFVYYFYPYIDHMKGVRRKQMGQSPEWGQ